MCREGYTKPLYLEIRTIECFYRRINRPSCVNVKIAFILNDTSPTNGATKAFLLLLQGLRIRGVHPHVVVPDKNGIYQELKVSKGVSIIALDDDEDKVSVAAQSIASVNDKVQVGMKTSSTTLKQFVASHNNIRVYLIEPSQEEITNYQMYDPIVIAK